MNTIADHEFLILPHAVLHNMKRSVRAVCSPILLLKDYHVCINKTIMHDGLYTGNCFTVLK